MNSAGEHVRAMSQVGDKSINWYWKWMRSVSWSSNHPSTNNSVLYPLPRTTTFQDLNFVQCIIQVTLTLHLSGSLDLSHYNSHLYIVWTLYLDTPSNPRVKLPDILKSLPGGSSWRLISVKLLFRLVRYTVPTFFVGRFFGNLSHKPSFCVVLYEVFFLARLKLLCVIVGVWTIVYKRI